MAETGYDKINYMMFLFLTGSIAGWCIEVGFRSYYDGSLNIPGFLFGPYCPIYGTGLLIITFMCNHRYPLISFFKIFVLTSVLEYIASLVIEKIFGILLWDYSYLPFSIGTRVSLAFSVVWAFLGLVVLLFVEPFLKRVYEKRAVWLRKPVLAGMGIILVDFLLSVAVNFVQNNQ
jgi:uncharacterized membrane protein